MHILSYVVDFVRVLSFFAIFFVGLVHQYLDAITTTRLIFTCFSD